MHDHHLDAPSGGHHHSDTTGIHGMLLFGDEEALYLSHLPMFASPHNFQVILKVGFDEAVQNTLLSDFQAAGADIHTFFPHPFPITELQGQGGEAPARTSIRGTIFRGHFERRGKPIAADVVATVRQVVYFVELDVTEKHREDWELSYLCFGRPGRLYLAHAIKARPDFDHVVSVRMVPETVTNPGGELTGADVSKVGYDLAQTVTLRERRDTQEDRLSAGEVATAGFLSTFGPEPVVSHGYFVQIEIVSDLYLETGDLA